MRLDAKDVVRAQKILLGGKAKQGEERPLSTVLSSKQVSAWIAHNNTYYTLSRGQVDLDNEYNYGCESRKRENDKKRAPLKFSADK